MHDYCRSTANANGAFIVVCLFVYAGRHLAATIYLPVDFRVTAREGGRGEMGRVSRMRKRLHLQLLSGFKSYMRALSDIQPNPIYLSGGLNPTSVGHSKSRFVELHEMDLRFKPDNARKLDTCNRSECSTSHKWTLHCITITM